MGTHYIVDSHCDTIGKILDDDINILQGHGGQVSIQKLINAQVGLQFFAAWIGPKRKYGPYLQRGLRLIDAYHTMLITCQEYLSPVYRFEDIEKAKKNRKIASLLSVEGGEILEGEISNLRILYQLGVRALTLTWNYRNELGDGVMEGLQQSGLSTFGKEVITEMNRLGMMIDVSHLSEKGFYDVLGLSSKPIAATHSNAKALCSHCRNLTDQQIKDIAAKRGIIGINFYPPFLSEKSASSHDIFRHIDYIAGLVGMDYVGFGSDFDGIDTLPENIKGPEGFSIIIEEMLKNNYSEDDIKKITHGNYLIILKDNLF